MKKLCAFIFCVILAFAISVTAFAGCDGQNVETVQFISELKAISYDGSDDFAGASSSAGYEGIYSIVGGSKDAFTDLNQGCGIGSNYIRLLRKNTTDANDAVRGVIAVYAPANQAGEKQITVNGITYEAVAGKRIDDYFLFNKKTEFDALSFNDDHGDSCTCEVYLYYTKDKRAGDPITDFKFIFDYENRNQPNLIQTTDGESANFNNGYGGKIIYLQIVRGNNGTGSIFNDTASVIAVCAGVAVILAVCAIVIIKSKKKKQSAQ